MTVTAHRIKSGRPPVFSAENLADNDRGEKNEQQEIGKPGGELNRGAAELMEQCHQHGDQHAADHCNRYARLVLVEDYAFALSRSSLFAGK
jgi:hypothetical protein